MTIETATMIQMASGEKLPLLHLVESLGALALWAMAEPGRRFEVAEVYGRVKSARVMRVTLGESDQKPRSVEIQLNVPVTAADIDKLFELAAP